MWATESGCRQAIGPDHDGIPPTPFLPAAFLEDFALLWQPSGCGLPPGLPTHGLLADGPFWRVWPTGWRNWLAEGCSERVAVVGSSRAR
jgi:hypothetical protein